MSTEVAEKPIVESIVDGFLLKAISDGVSNAFVMCNTQAKIIGVSAVPAAEQGNVTGLVGVHGNVSGFITVNFSERFAMKSVEGLLQDSFDVLNSQVVDGVGEITNIIAGGIKGGLSSSPWAFVDITVPAVIVGNGYQMAYAKGLNFITVSFEHQDAEALMLSDRLMQVSMSLLQL